ncbi:thioredoxin domain-containing protein [Haloprofundus salilacus]|uniref:thioredoxin domain-containing protein n=1 Tax=Haloprofundus salilacus TaxID=2876190 RepID=UPI001CCCF86A|nr:thioredoxin domain-containing protein [Haloprofundus salilacus]
MPDIGDVIDRLVEGDVIRENDDGSLTTTAAFEETRSVYADTYLNVGEETFVETVAELFDLESAAAETQIEANGVTREQLVAYLAVQSFLDEAVDSETKAVMAHVVCEVTPPSPIPEAVTRLDDESYTAFLDEHPNAVLTVWKRHCEPCERLKDDLDELLDALPDDVAVGGLDGETASGFRLAHAVNSAPAVLWFRDGEKVDARTGYVSPSEFGDVVADTY